MVEDTEDIILTETETENCEVTDTSLKLGIQKNNAPGFEPARREELKGLIENGTLLPTSMKYVREGTRIF